MTWLLIAVGGALGAPARYLTDRWISDRYNSAFPWGTLTVNLLGSLALGVMAGAALRDASYAILGTGFCGAFTTFSTFAYETDRLLEDGACGLASANAVLHLLGCIGMAAVGWAIANALVG